MKNSTKIMWIEKKSGESGMVGPARIGRVSFSKSGKSIKYNEKTFKSLKGAGFKANYYELESGDEYWISGCRKDGKDALCNTDVEIDEDVLEEYWVSIRKQPHVHFFKKDKILIIIESILMGIFATFFMDILAGFLVKRKLIHPFISPEAIGRWFLYMFRGKFIHKDINKTPALKNEKLWCFISHYMIGVILAGIYLFLELKEPIIRDQVWIPLIYGIITVVLPWFWLLPSIGIGFMASKSPNRSLILRTNLVNHTNFGLGLFVWIVSLHRFFM